MLLNRAPAVFGSAGARVHEAPVLSAPSSALRQTRAFTSSRASKAVRVALPRRHVNSLKLRAQYTEGRTQDVKQAAQALNIAFVSAEVRLCPISTASAPGGHDSWQAYKPGPGGASGPAASSLTIMTISCVTFNALITNLAARERGLKRYFAMDAGGAMVQDRRSRCAINPCSALISDFSPMILNQLAR